MADILNLQQHRNVQQQARPRCEVCEGRRQVWDWKAGAFVTCPACTHPEPTRAAA